MYNTNAEDGPVSRIPHLLQITSNRSVDLRISIGTRLPMHGNCNHRPPLLGTPIAETTTIAVTVTAHNRLGIHTPTPRPPLRVMQHTDPRTVLLATLISLPPRLQNRIIRPRTPQLLFLLSFATIRLARGESTVSRAVQSLPIQPQSTRGVPVFTAYDAFLAPATGPTSEYAAEGLVSVTFSATGGRRTCSTSFFDSRRDYPCPV